jgi:hypothetical protein
MSVLIHLIVGRTITSGTDSPPADVSIQERKKERKKEKQLEKINK